MIYLDELNVTVSRTIPETKREIKFDKNSYKIFMLIEGEKNLFEVYQKAGIDVLSFTQAVESLFEQGMLVVVKKEQFIKKEIIEKIKSSLAAQVGPLAQLIMAEAFLALGLTNDLLPTDKIKIFVEKINDQIPIDKAVKFKKSIANNIDNYFEGSFQKEKKIQ
jgi:hypothetical protein